MNLKNLTLALASLALAFILAACSETGTASDGLQNQDNGGTPEVSSSSEEAPAPEPSSSSVYVPPAPSSSSKARSSSSVYVPPSSSSVAQEPEAIIITLTGFVQNVAQDALGGAIDPRIKALTYAYRAGDLLKADSSKLLLSVEDVTNWTGSVADTMDISYAGAYPDSLYTVIRINDADLTSEDIVMNCAIGFNASKIFKDASYTGMSCANPNSVDVTFNAKFIRK
jgi:hypothetical protein